MGFDLESREGFADWALAGNAPQNSGGLAADAALATAVTLCLFTDKQLPATIRWRPLAANGDLRG